MLEDNQTSACCSSGQYDGNGCKRGGSGERTAQTSDKRSPGLDEMAKKQKKTKKNKKRVTYRKKTQKMCIPLIQISEHRRQALGGLSGLR